VGQGGEGIRRQSAVTWPMCFNDARNATRETSSQDGHSPGVLHSYAGTTLLHARAKTREGKMNRTGGRSFCSAELSRYGKLIRQIGFKDE